MFDLEKAVLLWQRSLSQKRAFTAEDLEELETHLRDHIDEQVARGVPEKEAFLAATRRLGDPTFLATEYRKMVWTNARTRGKLVESILAEAAMIASYGRIGFRNLVRRPIYALINVLGLSVGLACCLLIALFVRFELSFDRHNEDADRIYRVSREWRGESGRQTLSLARISMPIGPALVREFPEVEKAVRLLQVEGSIAAGDRRFIENRVFIVDSTYFDVFTEPLLEGSTGKALAEPNTVVVTEDAARKYFANTDPIGRSLRFFDEVDLSVTGVMAPMPSASHFHPDFLVSFRTIEAWTSEAERNEWGQYNNYGTYLLLANKADAVELQGKLKPFLRRHYQPENNVQDALRLQPLTGIHLDSHLDSEFEAGGSRTYVFMFIAVAGLVLIIACFNFINLATARSSYRGKEVGLRKVMGAEKSQLVKQFLGETLVLAVISLVAAGGIAWLAMPAFTRITGRDISWSILGSTDALVAAAFVLVVVSLLAGLYPALFLSRFEPAEVFRQDSGGSWRSGLRSILVVAQFAVSIVLIVGVGVVFRQMSFVQAKDLGFDKERLVVLPVSSEMRSDFGRFRRQLEASPLIQSVTASKLVPSRSLVDHIGVSAEVNGSMQKASLALNPVDHDFVSTYGMQLAAGRDFSEDLASDSTEAYIINEAAVRLLGWDSPEDAVGKPFYFEGNSLRRAGKVVGVVKDFNFESLKNRIAPLALFIMPQRWQLVTVRIARSRIDEALDFLKDRWAVYRPDLPFTYSFVDQDFGALYEADRRVGRLFGYFASLAVIIASLGLFGLASFVTDRRRKEVGVRKVLGATVMGVVRMLSLDFLRLIAVAFLVACPIAYLLAKWWLEGFAYQTDVALSLFVGAGCAVAIVALATVSFQSIRSALTDPAMALRHE